MIQINLLPVRARKRNESVRHFISIYFLCVLLTLSAVAYLWISQSNQIRTLDTRLAILQTEVDQYSKFDTMLKDLQSKKEIVDKKRAIIQDLQRDRDRIVRVLALLSVQVPSEKVWFERLTESANTMTLNGVALSNETIAEFMKNLESSPYIERGSVSLLHSRQVTISNMKLREFQLVYRFFPFSAIQKKPTNSDHQSS